VLTLFSSTKPFQGPVSSLQRRALRSWRAVHPAVDLIVFGNGGQAEQEAITGVGARLVTEYERSASGAPSFRAMSAHARAHGRFDFQVYVNGDILLDHTLATAMAAAAGSLGAFLLIGERLDLAEGACLELEEAGWLARAEALSLTGRLSAHGPTAMDFFGFQRGLWDEAVDVSMGRAGCDQALLQHCLSRRVPVIDASLAVVALHQSHDYSHVPGGAAQVFAGEDTRRMQDRHRLGRGLPTIADAGLRLTATRTLEPNGDRLSALRRLELSARYQWGAPRFALTLRALQRILGPRWYSPRALPLAETLASWKVARRLASTPPEAGPRP
jgi:hypothetical protein